MSTPVQHKGVSDGAGTGLLAGLRVLELGHFVAAPFCARLLGDLGADVIKLEPPSGDPARQWGQLVDGRSLWWSMHGRNKRCITVNLKSEAGRDLLLELVSECDVLLENFRPGQLEKLGLSEEVLRAARPDLILARVSGFGQAGPYSNRAAFGVIGEAVGGLRYLTNEAPGVANRPPVRVGVSIGDSIAGLYAAFGIMAVLWQRDRKLGDGRGRTVDVALTESVLSMMEGMLPEYGALGLIKQPTGGRIATAAPSNAYPTSDDSWILVAANSEPLFKRLVELMGRPELAEDPGYQGNQGRVRNADELDETISAWTRRFRVNDLARILDEADIPNTKVYNAADCAADPQYRFRGMVREVQDQELGPVLQAGIVPHIPESPGEVRWTGPDIGQHTNEVLRQLLGLDDERIDQLRHQGAI